MFLSRRGELIILPVASRVGRSFHGDWSSDSSRLRRLRRKEPLKSTIADRSFFLNGDSPRDFPSIFILRERRGRRRTVRFAIVDLIVWICRSLGRIAPRRDEISRFTLMRARERGRVLLITTARLICRVRSRF